jgi:hypothetical protein
MPQIFISKGRGLSTIATIIKRCSGTRTLPIRTQIAVLWASEPLRI